MNKTTIESQHLGEIRKRPLIVWPGWFRSARANRALSMERQTRYRDAVLLPRAPMSFLARLLARLPVIGELRSLRVENRKLRCLLNEKERKLADSDAQVVALSMANRHLTDLAKSRRKALREHGITTAG